MPKTSLRRWEKIFYITILVLALVTRFYMLETRAISHDESIHTKFSWNLYAGRGFQHNPMMHGPLLFEATAFSYFLFGPNDFTARIYTSLVGVALVMTPLLFRKWLGAKGAACTALLLLISPSISYYSRYIRHDAPLMLFSVLLICMMFEYWREGESRWLYGMAAAFALMYASKENAYLYTAMFIGMLTVPFGWRVLQTRWQRPDLANIFWGLVCVAVVCFAIFGVALISAPTMESALDDAGNSRVVMVETPWWGSVTVSLGTMAAFGALVLLYYAVGESHMREMRTFDILMALGTLTLPLGTAFFIKFAANLNIEIVYEAVRTGNFSRMSSPHVLAMAALTLLVLIFSAALGMWWDKQRWPIIALIHYAIFFVLFSTFFTWGFGVLSGLIGGLGYWMAQQGVRRGGQPIYYYFLIGPLYEYLPLLFSVGAGASVLRQIFVPRAALPDDEADAPRHITPAAFFPWFLLGWTVLSWAAYTWAGEKMPWLLVHIALPSIFLAGWGLDKLLATLTWEDFTQRRGSMLMLSLPLLVAALMVFGNAVGALRVALAPGIPEAGPTLVQLEPLGRLFGGLGGIVLFGGLFTWATSLMDRERAARLMLLTLVIFLSVLTVRTMVMLNFINYDLATEFLVYAHATPDVKVALRQIEDVSWRTTGTPDMVRVAYGEDGSWPFYWYFDAHFNNTYFYGRSPVAELLLESPVVIAGSQQWPAVEPILANDYTAFDYKYLWWPIQDYYGLTWERIRFALTDPAMRSALWDIIWDRDYTAYARLKNPEDPFSLQNWPYRKEFRLYVRRDLAQQVWSYRLGEEGVVVSPQPTVIPDPYIAGTQQLPLESSAQLPSNAVLRDVAVAPDGSLYAVDTANHKVWHFMGYGPVRHAWGEFGTGPGQFNEPWGIAVDDEGHVYVADTWNHRIQKFTAQGDYLLSWGSLAQVTPGDPAGEGFFFGPRGVAIGPDGLIYVTDTGNKRVQVFDAEGTFAREFGSRGAGIGQLNEPVGIAISAEGELVVADTWNRRVQVFTIEGAILRHWNVATWGSDAPDEKPYLTLDARGNVYISDPINRRVLAFDMEGRFLWALGGEEATLPLTFPQGLAVDEGVLYISDAYAGQVLGYQLP